MRRFFNALSLGLGVCACAPELPPEDAQRRPNIMVIVADDLGYTDLGALGNEIRTPNLDRLAQDGLLLANFLVSPACSPTRAMLLTGVDSHVAGLGTMFDIADDNQVGQPGYEGVLNDRVVTVPSAGSFLTCPVTLPSLVISPKTSPRPSESCSPFWKSTSHRTA